jgi:hypothetical protein
MLRPRRAHRRLRRLPQEQEVRSSQCCGCGAGDEGGGKAPCDICHPLPAAAQNWDVRVASIPALEKGSCNRRSRLPAFEPQDECINCQNCPETAYLWDLVNRCGPVVGRVFDWNAIKQTCLCDQPSPPASRPRCWNPFELFFGSPVWGASPDMMPQIWASRFTTQSFVYNAFAGGLDYDGNGFATLTVQFKRCTNWAPCTEDGCLNRSQMTITQTRQVNYVYDGGCQPFTGSKTISATGTYLGNAFSAANAMSDYYVLKSFSMLPIETPNDGLFLCRNPEPSCPDTCAATSNTCDLAPVTCPLCYMLPSSVRLQVTRI